MNTILITPRSLTKGSHVALDALKERGYDLRLGPAGETPTEAQLQELLPGCVGWLAGVEPVSEAVLASASGTLKVISRNGVGVDNIPLTACERLGISVRRANGANSQGVAELALGLMLAGLRQVPFCDASLKSGDWSRRAGKELRGSVLGIIGMGAIGRSVATMADAIGATVLGEDPFVDKSLSFGDKFKWAERSEIFRMADVITMHCPPPADNSTLIDAAVIQKMRNNAVLVNTARASLVDEAAVLEALSGNKLGCYATDVFHSEPPGLTSLIQSSRVIATPHIGGFTAESVQKASLIAVENILECLAGDGPDVRAS